MPRILKYVSHQKFPLTASLLIFLSHCFLNPPCLLLFGFYLLICLSSIFFFHRSRISNHRLLNARHQFGKKKIIFTVILKFFLLIWSQKEFLLFRVTISFFFFIQLLVYTFKCRTVFRAAKAAWLLRVLVFFLPHWGSSASYLKK